jgi:hypothetical protein
MVNIAKRGKKGLVAHCHCDYNATFAGRAMRLGIFAAAGMIFGQVKRGRDAWAAAWGRGSGI